MFTKQVNAYGASPQLAYAPEGMLEFWDSGLRLVG
jgi:hypothetical protein